MLGPLVGCLGWSLVSLFADLAPILDPPRPLRANPCTSHFSLSLPILPVLSYTPHRRSVLVVLLSFFAFLFLFLAPSAYRIRLSLFQGHPPHSFFPFPFQRSFTPAPFGTYSNSSSPSTIDYSFTCSSGQPTFTIISTRTRQTQRQRDLRRDILPYTSPLSRICATFCALLGRFGT